MRIFKFYKYVISEQIFLGKEYPLYIECDGLTKILTCFMIVFFMTGPWSLKFYFSPYKVTHLQYLFYE